MSKHPRISDPLEDFFADLPDELDASIERAKKQKIEAQPIIEGQLATASEALTFITAGNATFTARSKKTDTRYTFRIRSPRGDDGKINRNAAVQFVALMNGPDNENSFAYIGYIKRGVYYHGGAKSKVSRDGPSNKAFEWVFRKLSRNELPETLELWHEGRCGRCGRKLTVPSSIRSGIGPECATRML